MLNRLAPVSQLESDRDDDQFDLRDAVNFIWRQWKFIAAIVAVAILIGAIQLIRSTPIYTATAQVLLDPRRLKAPGDDAILSEENLNMPAFESQIAIVRSTTLLRRAYAISVSTALWTASAASFVLGRNERRRMSRRSSSTRSSIVVPSIRSW